MDDATLLKLAEAEILGEAKRAAVRHSIAGVSGWQPCPKPNKLFLTNTLLQTMASNRLLSRKTKSESENSFKNKKKKRERKLLQSCKKETNFVFKKPEKNDVKRDSEESKKKVQSKLSSKNNCDKIKLYEKNFNKKVILKKR